MGGSFKDTARKPFTAEDIRFTAKGDSVYAIALACPENGKITVKSMATGSFLTKREIKTVQLLGSQAPVRWTRNVDGLTIELPAQKTCSNTVAFEISPVDPAPLLDDLVAGGE